MMTLSAVLSVLVLNNHAVVSLLGVQNSKAAPVVEQIPTHSSGID